MSHDRQSPAVPVPAAPRSNTELVQSQREANEKLVLAAIQAYEDAEAAERRANELTLREKELEATAQFRERLIGIIGHDLRNPLSAMIMSAERLVDGGDLNEDDRQVAQRIVKSGRRMSRMISQLLGFTRARLGGGFPLKLEPVDIGEVCKNIADELRVASAADIRMDAKGDLTGAFDADLMAQVFSNIVGNAVEHGAEDTPVIVRVFEEAATIVAEVTNQGVDIAPDLLPVIFEPFHRGQTGGYSSSGNVGLGLYIACEIVRSHGGTLEARSAGGTTTFTVRLPRVPKSPAL